MFLGFRIGKRCRRITLCYFSFQKLVVTILKITLVCELRLAGFWIGGFGLGENMDERSALLTAITV